MKRLEELSDSLVRCNYPKRLISDGINKALPYSRDILLNPKDATSDEISSYIADVSTYSPGYHSYYPMVRDVFCLLQNQDSTEHIFKDKSLLQSKRQPPNIKNFLIRAKFSMTDDSGVRKCNSSRCKLCEIIITGKNYYFRNCQVNFNLTASMDCDVKYCIYVLECWGALSIISEKLIILDYG